MSHDIGFPEVSPLGLQQAASADLVQALFPHDREAVRDIVVFVQAFLDGRVVAGRPFLGGPRGSEEN